MSPCHHIKRVLLLAALLAASASPSLAQRSRITGIVTDQSGAAAAGAQVTVTATDHSTKRTVKTGWDGWYAIEGLPNGSYSVSIEHSAFKKWTSANVTLKDEHSRMDARLELGPIICDITIEGRADARAARKPGAQPNGCAVRVSGTVVDPTGAVHAATLVTAVSLGSGLRLEAKTNLDGEYTFECLPPGPYVISAEATGFSTRRRSIEALSDTRVNIVLALEDGPFPYRDDFDKIIEIEPPKIPGVLREPAVRPLPLSNQTYFSHGSKMRILSVESTAGAKLEVDLALLPLRIPRGLLLLIRLPKTN